MSKWPYNRRIRLSFALGVAVALVAPLWLVGCPVTPVRPYRDLYQHAQVEFLTKSLRGEVRVEPPIVTRLADDVLQVAVNIRSLKTATAVRFEYRGTFLDENWLEMESTPWTAAGIGPRDSKQVFFSSITTKAAAFRLTVR